MNDLESRDDDVEYSYVLLGLATDAEGNLYPVRSIVNKMQNKVAEADVEILDVLESSKAKKVEADRAHKLQLSSGSLPHLAMPTSKASISDVLEIFKSAYPDILPDSVLLHFGMQRPISTLSTNSTCLQFVL